MSRSELPPPARRDLVFLVLGGMWGTWIVLTDGQWSLMFIAAGTMLGPGFLRLLLSVIATGANGLSRSSELPPQSRSSLPDGSAEAKS